MFDLYLAEPLVPFTIALALLFGLVAMEIVFGLMGGTLLGLGADAEIDLDLDLDVDVPDLEGLDIDFGDADPADFELDSAPSTVVTDGPGALGWLGIGKMPILIWLAALLLGFGVTGYAVQGIAKALIAAPLPWQVVAVPAAAAGLWFTRTFGALFARALPKTESTAMSARHLGKRYGTVTQGTARRGVPSEVRVTDGHGNTHYLRGEPLKDEDEIPAGTRVLVLRHRLDQGYRLVPMGPET